MADDPETLQPSATPFKYDPSPTSTASFTVTTIDDDLPTNISSEEQLVQVPEECLSGNKLRPLRHVTEDGQVYTYTLQPMFYSVIFILLVELLERFSFYGVNYTQTSFLTGVYNRDWNAGMSSIAASSYVSISTAVAYTTPFAGAFLADSFLGDYWTVLFGAFFFYIPGLILILLSAVPYALGDEFSTSALALGLLFLWPTGTGIVKSVVNVFGAKQFHPLLQSSLIEAYYVKFYMCINIGALVGGIVVPLVAQHDIATAYTYPVVMLCLGILLFILGTNRYVKHKPSGNLFSKKPRASNVDSSIGLDTIFRITALIIPFNIAYSQMATTFIIQGTVMDKAFGFIDAASMNNADAISVLLFGWLVAEWFYPALARKDIRIPTTYKFAMGSALGAMAIAWALFMEYKIRATYEATGGKVNIMWQSVAYFLIGAGEIFAVSAAYEVAFTASPPEKKVLASALNLFCVGGIPNVLCIFLYQAAKPWFLSSQGTDSIYEVEDYVTARIDSYFLVLLVISLLGITINMLPAIRDFVASIEDKATDLVKTPVISRSPRLMRRKPSLDYSPEVEESPLLRMKRHQAYLKYGSGPVLYKQGSMRAGPSLSQRGKEQKKMKKSIIGKLYNMKKSGRSQIPAVVMTPEGRPLTAGAIKRQDSI